MSEYQTRLQTNFSSGELSPDMQGYVDLKDYINGLLKQENFINDNNGGVFFRQGTGYAANTAGNAQVKLVPFVFNKTQASVLEFSANRVRFYTSNGQLNVNYNVTAASWSGGIATVTIGTHVFLAGDTVTVGGITPSGYNGTFVLTSVTATQIKYAVSNPGAYVSGGSAVGPYQLVTPYALGPTSWAQIDDVMYLADGKNPIQQLTQLGAANWTLAPLTLSCGPFRPINSSAGSIMTVSGLNVSNASQIFASTDVGRHIIVLDSTGNSGGSAGAWKWAKIVTFTDTRHVVVDQWRTTTAARNRNVSFGAGLTITGATWAKSAATFTVGANQLVAGMSITVAGVTPSGYNGNYTITGRTGTTFTVALGSNPGAYSSGGTADYTPDYAWALGAWSDTTGYPTCLAFHQQRLVAGGATSDSSLSATTIYGSVIGVFTSFAPFDPDGTVNPDNAYSFQIASGRADGIQWMVPDQYLLIGTGAAEYIARSSGPVITPTDIDIKMQTSIGSSGLYPAQMNYRLVIPQRGNNFLHQWNYNWQLGGYMGTLINKESDHIFDSGMTRIAFQLNPSPRVWAVRADGQLVVATDNGQDWAFGRCILGGAFGSGNAVVEDVVVIPTATFDQVWIVVKRTVNGQTVRFVEYLTPPFDGVMADAYFVDAGLQYNGAPTSSLSGFGYLNGQTVAVFGDGVYQGDQVVPSNGVLAVTSASKFAVGLKYSGYCETLQLNDQQIQGKIQYAIRAYLRLYQTWGGSILSGATYSTARPLVESASSLYTGATRTVLDHGSDTEQHLYFQQNSPYPMAVLNASIDFQAGES